MKKSIFIILGILILVIVGLLTINPISKGESEISELRKQHESFLRNSPFKEMLLLSKKERKAKGLPPNKFFERQWELTMDPRLGRPAPERVFETQEYLRQQALFSKVPGENTNDWVERGPNNVGGRSRAIMYDPNDNTNKRVFAGGVSGGLWVNNDITNANSSWTEVNIPQNLAISSITFDPNATTTFYAGTGEAYVWGKVNGNGLWQSLNSGLTWARVFGGVTGETVFSSDALVSVNSPGVIIDDYAATTASFGSPLGANITGNLVLADDSTTSPSEACNALTNGLTMAGNIAVIERGTCDFVIKVKNAQNAGAIAVIMVNNVGGPPFIMAGTDGSITIPSVMVSKKNGQLIMDQLGSGVNVTLKSHSGYNRYLTPGIHHINDVALRNNNGSSEIYVAASTSFYTDSNPSSLLGFEDYGLYKSSDDGFSWSKIDLPNGLNETEPIPNDIEIGSDNSIWLGTTNLRGTSSDGSGKVMSSSNGTTFTVKTTISNGVRTQIAVSQTDADVIYVLSELSTGDALSLVKTEDGFDTAPTIITQPQDIDTADRLIDDFTGGQGSYNLLLEVDPTNHSIVYVGGIDLFRSSNKGANWSQISKWSNNNDLGGLGVSLVHADQHALVFNPDNSNIGVFGNDGGVYYGSTLSSASTSTSAISARNKDYNTVQFYKGAIGSDEVSERIIGGTQDNGTLDSGTSTTVGINSYDDINNGGDGAYVFLDSDKVFLIASYPFNNYTYRNYNFPANAIAKFVIDDDDTTGDFVNPADLDNNNNTLYSNGTDYSLQDYQINRYSLVPGTATKTILSDDMLDGAPTAFKASTYTTTTLFVGTDNGKLFRLTDANASPTWTEITGNDFYGSISCIELGASENDIYVSFYNYGVTSIFYSFDAGNSWTSKEGDFPDIPVNAIMVNPLNSNEVIIGTDLGVWAAPIFSDPNPSWYQSNNGMKDVKVTSFDLRTSDNTVLASTHGRGMFTGQFTAEGSTLSVNDIVQNDLIKVYPTISNGTFKISSNGVIKEGTLKVFDINGRSVYTKNVKFDSNRAQNISLNTSAGMYVVKFSSGETILTYKIIIR